MRKLFGGSTESQEGWQEPAQQANTSPPEQPEAAPREPQTAAQAVEVLERTIQQFESVLGKLESQGMTDAPSIEHTLEVRDVLQRLEEAVGQLGYQAQQLAEMSSRLEGGVADLTSRVAPVSAQTWEPAEPQPAYEPEPAYEPPPPPEPQEPRFWVSDAPVSIIIAGVSGFQGLMELQRAMGGLSHVETASVVGYKDGQASLEVLLERPASATDIVEGLATAVGSEIVVEESYPDDLLLRLRFLEREAGLSGALLSDSR